MFSLRIDLDTRIGVREGLPRILEALRKTDSTASFFLVLGREPFLPHVLRRKFFSRKNYDPWYTPVERPHRRKISYGEFARRMLLPVNFSEESTELLRLAEKEHEFGCHAIEHEEWALSLPKMDVDLEFSDMIARFENLFGKKPRHFASPAFRTRVRVLESLDRFRFETAGDLPGDKPFHPVINGKRFKHMQVPVNLMCSDTVPLIEDAWARGIPDSKIADQVFSRIMEKHRRGLPAVLYGHGLLEGAMQVNVLERILVKVKEEGLEVVSTGELAKHFSGNYMDVPLEVVNR
ncbi:polysaccharide deacetylase family protein [Candidatus Micrarchaeota archaeon]|nr:polysaccharide deacetylase family protein [Candidatus Micrarchaeota archaeon]